MHQPGVAGGFMSDNVGPPHSIAEAPLRIRAQILPFPIPYIGFQEVEAKEYKLGFSLHSRFWFCKLVRSKHDYMIHKQPCTEALRDYD